MGIAGHALKDEDHALKLVHANTLDKMLFFTDRGKVYAEYVFRIAEGGRTDKGTPAINIINLEADEKITEMVCVHEFSPAKYLLMGTANGKVKRTPLSDFANIRSSGIIAMGRGRRRTALGEDYRRERRRRHRQPQRQGSPQIGRAHV